MVVNPLQYAMLSAVGRVRTGNEDACAASPTAGAFVVCDGMGGAAAGEVASRLAVDTFLGHLTVAPNTPSRATPDLLMDQAVQAANLAVYRQAKHSRHLRGMGTTLVALLVEPDATSLKLCHVGDSRCYRMRDDELQLLTRDHSLVEEQVRLGEITPEMALISPLRNIITRAIGSVRTVEPEIQHIDTQPGDLYLLASDGLTRDLNEAALAQILRRCLTRAISLEDTCQMLVDEANDAGGGDNITVLLLKITDKA